jgi:hypothetical protein
LHDGHEATSKEREAIENVMYANQHMPEGVNDKLVNSLALLMEQVILEEVTRADRHRANVHSR